MREAAPSNRSRIATAVMAAAALGATVLRVADIPAEAQRAEPPLVLGLDHIPLAVTDLAAASERYRQLGFTLKPGRPHENGIRNQHVKFADGTAIELITAGEARDALTAEYLRHLAGGDGPAFVSFFAPEMNRVAGQFDAEGRAYRRSGGLLDFPEGDDLRYIFFGQGNTSPTDRPEHFRHANGADALIGVWIASDDLAAERTLLGGLGVVMQDEDVQVPDAVRAPVARLPRGEVVLLPGARQRVPGRPIVGATLRVRDLTLLQRALAKGTWRLPPVVHTTHHASVFVPPDLAHGLWLEFRQERQSPQSEESAQ